MNYKTTLLIGVITLFYGCHAQKSNTTTEQNETKISNNYILHMLWSSFTHKFFAKYISSYFFFHFGCLYLSAFKEIGFKEIGSKYSPNFLSA